jgi:hypothetical protein
MAIVLTVTTDDPTTLATLWPAFAGRAAVVNVDADHMWIDVDLRNAPAPAPEPEPEPEPVKAEPTGDAEVIALDAKSRDRHPTAQPEPTGATCADAVVAALDAEPTVEFTAADILCTVEGYTDSTVKFTIAELARRGRITRVRRGVFRSASGTAS